MNSKFWLYDPSILLKKEEMFEFWPHQKQTMSGKLNAVTRSILVLTTLGYLSTKSINILISGIVTLVVIVALFKTKEQEGFDFETRTKNADKELNNININELAKKLTNPTKKNPYMNHMMTDYTNNPDKPPALPIFNSKVKESVDNAVFDGLDPRLFRTLGDAIEYDTFARNFHTLPVTTNPSDQKAFAEFCYGNMKSCKEGDCFGYINSCDENNYLCKPSYLEEDESKVLNSEEKNDKLNVDFSKLDSETLTAFQQLDPTSSTYESDMTKLLDPNISREDKIKLGLIKTTNLFGQKKAKI